MCVRVRVHMLLLQCVYLYLQITTNFFQHQRLFCVQLNNNFVFSLSVFLTLHVLNHYICVARYWVSDSYWVSNNHNLKEVIVNTPQAVQLGVY